MEARDIKPGDFTTVIYVGRPDQEKPLCGFDNVRRFYENAPNKVLIVIARTAKDAEEIILGVSALKLPEGSKFKVIMWEDDTKLLDTLSKILPELAFSKIFGLMWYECPEKHPTRLRAEIPTEVCETCGSKELTLIQPNEDEVRAFCDIFGKVISLVNFDTRSGVTLHQQVNPTVNVLKNIPYALPEISSRVETKAIFQTGKGKLAYCVAAGPSLEDAIPHLKRLQDTGIVICVGRLYKQLREEGIRVDYTVSCEMFDWDSAIFDDVGDTGNTVLCFPPVCAPLTVQKWTGRKYCMLDMRTAELLGRQDFSLGGNSVAHHQLNLACEILQCDAVVLVGQDLAYTKPDLNTHYGPQPKNWPDEVKDMDRGLQKELYVESTGHPPYYPQCHIQYMIAGQAIPAGPVMVRSSFAYQDFATLFTILINRHGKRVGNACPNGQKINGTEYINLETFDPQAWLSQPQVPRKEPAPAPV